jgi:hypothetical protein
MRQAGLAATEVRSTPGSVSTVPAWLEHAGTKTLEGPSRSPSRRDRRPCDATPIERNGGGPSRDRPSCRSFDLRDSDQRTKSISE